MTAPGVVTQHRCDPQQGAVLGARCNVCGVRLDHGGCALCAACCGAEPAEPANDLVQCQGCGAVRSGYWLNRGHNCWRAEDGSYEEGGTFQ